MMRDISIMVDIDLDDVYSEMNRWDKNRMVELLKDEGYIKEDGYDIPISKSQLESQFHDELIGLSSKFYSMSNEEIELIENLYKKYC